MSADALDLAMEQASQGAVQQSGDPLDDAMAAHAATGGAEAAPTQKPQTAIEHFEAGLNLIKEHPFTVGPAMLESAASSTAGAVGRTLGRMWNLTGTLTGQPTSPVEGSGWDWQWQPHLEAGKQIQNLTAQEGQKVSGAYDDVAGTGPIATKVKESVGPIMDALTAAGAAEGVRGVPGALRSGKVTPGDALQAMRDSVGPDVVTHDANPMSDHGDTLIQAYKKVDEARADAVTAKYDAAKAANDGDMQMDGSTFVSDAKAALKPQGRSRFLPASVQGILDTVDEAKGQMSLDDFEGYRTQLSNEARKASQAGDGNAVAAIREVRNALENVQPVEGTSAAAKALYDDARAAHKARMDAIEADPAMDAAVNDKVSGDKFFRRFVINGDRDSIGQMRQNLSGNDQALQTISTGTIDHLRAAGGVDAFGSGDFKAGPFNKAWRSLSPKRDVLFADPTAPEYLDMLGGVAQGKPPTMVQKLGGHVADVAENVTNVQAGGVPVGTVTRSVVQKVLPKPGKVRPYVPQTLSELVRKESTGGP